MGGSKELKPYYGCIYLKPPEQKSVFYLWFWNIGCDRMAVNSVHLHFLPFSKKSLRRRVFFLWECLIALDPPQPPLKRGAFRLNTMCKNLYCEIC
ncbi:hypothetical protein BCV64_01340 [Cylindrospermopsis raciborskii MVCC14]|nr:hypothetical protein BCV64_01340 [Cylindrospermopsis raciborskii MVCC14]